ncbi:heme NO-binding domain-containing protein [Cognatishimia activa]|uniref:Heme NO binding protein n=1 Tax=Cognatishimia activa TaxID=1715691 RepID=A0A0P1IUT3_9RHOB|nr:heme NO-binding domain-containing protein [Cognatishimia activa]MEE2945900.1 heme NO-binding domain-containing protein [Pseudomonadota bacterium]CUI90227.1 Heme NO binding protein [Cognatishimia activa]CUK25694.1 Heme NO binding protein [Cognatishimia activa]
MHGLINRAVECFVRDTYGDAKWLSAARRAGLQTPQFEAMLHYDDEITSVVVDSVAAELDLPVPTVLEDIGTYLVSSKSEQAPRRLLRFSGVTFLEFLHSLDDLRDRARLALEDLDLPELKLQDHGGHCYSLECRHDYTGFSYVFMGVLRTMADDYGALVFLETTNNRDINIQLFQEEFSAGRRFELGAKPA